jgi:spore coat polysaccharide biosynthesis protein SpsF (cytidylyltransferase family)
MIRRLATDVVAVLQARVSSSRLPGKALKPILGRPMLRHQIDRVRRAASLGELVVATSVDGSDDAIAALCADAGVACFRGSLDDVLDRVYQAARRHSAAAIVRLTGDCPLADPATIDEVVAVFRRSAFDLVRTDDSFPDGLDVEVVSAAALERAWRDATRPSDREHVTLFINRQPELFRIGMYQSERDRSHLRLTVDEPQDFELVERIYGELYPRNAAFTSADVFALLDERPDLVALNRGIRRNEGLRRSLAADPQE